MIVLDERELRRAVMKRWLELENIYNATWAQPHRDIAAYIQPDRPILETVTPHIAQALVATAIGLLAAIPAVMAYNYFTSKIRVFQVEMENFSIDFLNIMKRHFFRE